MNQNWYEFRCPSAAWENIDCHACCSMFAICVSPSPNDEVWNIESRCESTLLSCLILHLWQSAYDFLDVFLGSLLTCKTMHLYKSHYHQAALCAKWGQCMVKETRVCWTRIKYSLLVKTHRPHVVLICLFGGYIWIGVLYIV